MTPETLRKIEDYIAQQPTFSIKLEDPDSVKAMSLKDFIMSFHTGRMSTYDNLYQDGTKVAKGSGRRSLVDTIIACQSTLGVSVNDVLDVFREAHARKRMSGWYCKHIKRFVFRIDQIGWALSDSKDHGDMCVHTGTLDQNTDITFNDIFEDAKDM